MVAEKIRKILLKLKYGKRLVGNSFSLRKTSDIKISDKGKITLGKVLLNNNVFLCASDCGNIVIEDGVSINRNTVIVSKGSVFIGSGTSIGPNVCIYDHDHLVTKDGFLKNGFNTGSVTIGKNVWIAAGVIILKGSVIGDNCVIGAGTLIKGTVANNSMVYSQRTLHTENLR